VGEQLVVGLGDCGQDERRLAAGGAVEGDLLGQDRLSGPRGADDHDRGAASEPAAQHAVEVRHPGLEAIRGIGAA
jgi:hypothetical protein